MSNDNIRKTAISVPAFASYAGLAIAIWGLIENNLIFAVISLGLLNIVLIVYLSSIYGRYRKHKRHVNIDAQLHRLATRTREYVTTLRCSENLNDTRHLTEAATKNALTVASNIFTLLVGSECTASVMFREEGEKLRTALYCHNVDPKRESTRSKNVLSTGEGVAGEAFSTGCVVSWHRKDSDFMHLRPEHEVYYISGISVPFKVGLEVLGLLNIDTMSENVFDSELHKDISCTLADTIGSIVEMEIMWQEHNE